MESNQPSIGYLKYCGKAVESGVIDALSAGESLISFSRTVNHLASVKYPFLSDVEINTPVMIKKGSWLALIPDDIETIAKAGSGIVATAYFSTVAKKLAENGFKDKTLTDVLKDGLKACIWLVRLAIHVKDSSKRKFENLSWRKENQEIGVTNDEGKMLWVPECVIRVHELTPEYLLQGMVKAIQENRTLAIGVEDGNDSDVIEVTEKEKGYFIPETEETDVLFPELEHGATVELQGYVTRGTQTSNSIGFRYDDHILTCHPREGSITRFKKCLFLKCKILGEITRAEKNGGTNDPRPKIIFDTISVLTDDQGELSFVNAK